MREDLEKPNSLRIFRQYKNVNTIKNQKPIMKNSIAMTIANTITTLIGTFTASAICFTLYTIISL